jgi:hypothetical protein
MSAESKNFILFGLGGLFLWAIYFNSKTSVLPCRCTLYFSLLSQILHVLFLKKLNYFHLFLFLSFDKYYCFYLLLILNGYYYMAVLIEYCICASLKNYPLCFHNYSCFNMLMHRKMYTKHHIFLSMLLQITIPLCCYINENIFLIYRLKSWPANLPGANNCWTPYQEQ